MSVATQIMSSTPGRDVSHPRPAIGGDRAAPHTGFTLVELLAVIVLMALLVGTAVIGLDGVTNAGRVRAALGQVAAADRLARLQATSDGRPRRLCLASGTQQCVLRRPAAGDADQEPWPQEGTFVFPTGATIRRLVLAGDHGTPEGAPSRDTVRVRSDGTSPDYVVLVEVGTGNCGAAAFHGLTGLSRYTLGVTSEETVIESLLHDLEQLTCRSPEEHAPHALPAGP